MPLDKWGHNKPWRHLYQNAAWRNLRVLVLHRFPICNICHRRPSTIADHIKDHKGNVELFYSLENLQGVCKHCHDEKTGQTSHEGCTPADKAPKATAIGDAALDAALKGYADAAKTSTG